MPGQNSATLPTMTDTKKDAGLEPSAMEILKRDFPYHCRRLRQALGWSSARMAFEMGVGDTWNNQNKQGKMAISRWESGAHVPQERYLLRFLEIQAKYDELKKKVQS